MRKYHRLITITITLLLFLNILGIYLLQGFNVSEDYAHRKIFNAFYSMPSDSLDAVYFGASSVTRYWIPALAFDETGIAVSGLATTGQPFVMIKYLMEEAKKTQNDALFIVEFRHIFKNTAHVHEANIRRTTDNMKPSLTRLKAVDAGIAYMNSGGNDVSGNPLGVYFPALEAANRTLRGTLGKGVPYFDKSEKSWNNGFIFSESSFLSEKVPKSQYNTSDKEPLPPENEEALYELLDYCDSIDNDILFVLSPYSANKTTYPRINTAIEIIEANGYNVLNMNTPEMLKDIGINWKKDFYNVFHTNLNGAQKYTLYLADYLQEKYDFEDHRNDPTYSGWAESVDLYKEKLYTEQNK